MTHSAASGSEYTWLIETSDDGQAWSYELRRDQASGGIERASSPEDLARAVLTRRFAELRGDQDYDWDELWFRVTVWDHRGASDWAGQQPPYPPEQAGQDPHNYGRYLQHHQAEPHAVEVRTPRQVRAAILRGGHVAAGYQDCTYHGTQNWIESGSDEDRLARPARIVVETAEPGPTERERLTVLRELRPFDNSDFGWGYNGGGTSRSAASILADALEIEHDRIAFGGNAEPLFVQLREDFCEDVLSQLCDHWRMRRGAILRWICGWYTHYDLADLPAAIATLPPIHFDAELDASPRRSPVGGDSNRGMVR